MNMLLRAAFALAATTLAAAAPRTLRVDYYHTGTAASETFALDRAVLEPLPWPGDPDKAVDTTNFGKYLFEVVDRATNKVIYSRGFCSVYGEWETTGEARGAARTFSESLRFPRPDGPVQVNLKKRDARNAFREVWSFTLDPADPAVDTSATPAPGELIAIRKSGDPAAKVDLLIIGDGYTRAERPKFEREARRLADALFAVQPFKDRQNDFNVWGLCPAAERSGVSRPSVGRHLRSPLGAAYDAFGLERYVLTFDNRALRDAAAHAPYEFLEILVNGDTYGGAGIFGQFSTVAAGSLWAPYIFVHEFGHHFAGLADEYYTSPVAYESGPERPEPWEPNATADPRNPKWKALVTPGTPLPTPWKKDAFDAHSRETQARRQALRAAGRPESEIDALFRAQQAFETGLLGGDVHHGAVGAFEGANYESRGYYRAQEDCVMFTRDEVPFCAACAGAIRKVIALYAKP
ncbi:IgA Peptidase M64 [Mesoterricola sediminis]|uniref:Peptidase M64 N-terminal domain-containing protein n=1 Tax=Mesoterricola sediminis TaxID=2927980 RepID=A0AA48GYQ4_9BACT|nr:IgA Peptidase M64 [Mesoterricola sediminis]BDU76487.1 hypothetical protein METESE_14450 [Mesoterricola sediminis]